MKRHISIFALLLSAFAAVGPAVGAGTWVINGGYYYIGSTFGNISIQRMSIDGKPNAYTAQNVPENTPAAVTFRAYPDKGTEIADWGQYVGNNSAAIMNPSMVTWTGRTSETYPWGTGEKSGNEQGYLAVRFDYIRFIVTFDTNGGTPTPIKDMEKQTIVSTINLPSVAKDGYEFAGWKNEKGKVFKAENTSGEAFWDDDEKEFYADLTAQWKGKSYKVTIDPNDGTGGECDGYTVSDRSQTLTVTPPTRDGHTIQSWTVSGAAGGSPSVSGTTLTIPANTYGHLTLTPNWEADTFTITYKPGSGTPGDEYTDTKTWGVSKALRDKTYADPKGQYVQDGWNTTKESFEGEPDYGLKAAYTDNAPITLFPHWKLNGYKLTIHHKGAYYDGKLLEETALESLVVGTTNLNEILVAVPTNGAAFYGYYSTEGGSTQIYDEHGKCCKVQGVWSETWAKDGTFEGSADLEVWAKWGPPPEHCTISAVCDPTVGGMVEPASTNVVKGKDTILTAKENPGYSFWHWTNSNGVVVSEKPEYSFTVTADATYTAVFTGNVVKVTCYPTLTETIQLSVTYGSPYGELPNPTPPSGKELEGWYTLPGGMGDKITAETIVNNVNDHILFANWTDKTKFDVIFIDTDGGNGAITNKNQTTGTPVPPLAPTPAVWTRQYYHLVGWDPPLPQTVGMSDLEFTAVWWSIGKDMLDCPNLDFEATGNWKPSDKDNTAVGGWCMRMDDLSRMDNLTANLKESGMLTFHWKGNANRMLIVKLGDAQTNFTYKSSTWQEETIPITIDQGASINLQFTCTDPWVVNDFCAIDHITWTPGAKPVETYAVTYDKGSYGDGAGRTDTKTNDVDLVLAGVLFTRDNYTQDGWSKNKDGLTPDYALGGTYTENAAITLYPHWLENGKYTVSYSAGTDATGSAEAQTVHIGETVVLHGDGHFSRTGYSQDGWATSDLGEKVFDFNETYEEDTSTTLYPCWTNNRYTVTFDAQGGSAVPAQDVTYGQPYGTLEEPTLEGFSFTGWFLGETKITAETVVTEASNHTLTAKWEKNVGELSRILDCDNLKFVPGSVGGWTKCTDFYHKGDSCLRSTTANAEVKATITESGTLTVWWRGAASDSGGMELKIVKNTEIVSYSIGRAEAEEKNDKWFEGTAVSVTIDAVPVDLTFKSTKVGEYVAIDHVTWTPEGKEPEYADTDTPVTGFSMADGKLGFSFIGDGSTYHLLGTNDLVAPMPWPMVFETNKASGTILFDIPVKADEPKMFYRIRALQ